MKLSDHFTLEEMTRSATASARNINNALHPAHPHDAAVIANLKHLCEEVLEPLRRHVGGPILISSGYRCPALNTAVGGATGSQHMTGEAADIHINSIEEGKRWVTWIMELLDSCELSPKPQHEPPTGAKHREARISAPPPQSLPSVCFKARGRQNKSLFIPMISWC